jgi:hypothetical protein
MVAPIDRAAFLAAAFAAAQPSLKGVTLPGVGDCWQRPLTAGDVLDAQDARDALAAAGLPADRKVNMAIGLAQTLCDEAGQPLFDPHNPDHVRALVALPWAAVQGLLVGDKPGPEGDAPNA